MVFLSLQGGGFKNLVDLNLYLVNYIALFLALIVAFLISKVLDFNDRLKGAFLFCTVCGNVAYMGLPMSELALGEGSLSLASMIAGIHATFFLTFGLFALQYYSNNTETDIKSRILKTPLLWGVILGVLYSITRLPLPISNFFEMIGSSASPVALVSIGTFLYDVDLGGIDFGPVTALSFTKLILLPLLVLGISSILIIGNLSPGLNGIPLSTSLIQASMPIAVFTFVIAKKFDTECEFVASSIIATTVASIPVISLLLLFL